MAFSPEAWRPAALVAAQGEGCPARNRRPVARPVNRTVYHGVLGRPKDGLGIYIYSCHAGELFGFVPVARDEQAFSC